jgi:hypothetical protein
VSGFICYSDTLDSKSAAEFVKEMGWMGVHMTVGGVGTKVSTLSVRQRLEMVALAFSVVACAEHDPGQGYGYYEQVVRNHRDIYDTSQLDKFREYLDFYVDQQRQRLRRKHIEASKCAITNEIEPDLVPR